VKRRQTLGERGQLVGFGCEGECTRTKGLRALITDCEENLVGRGAGNGIEAEIGIEIEVEIDVQSAQGVTVDRPTYVCFLQAQPNRYIHSHSPTAFHHGSKVHTYIYTYHLDTKTWALAIKQQHRHPQMRDVNGNEETLHARRSQVLTRNITHKRDKQKHSEASQRASQDAILPNH
jgi:hypothetical protein